MSRKWLRMADTHGVDIASDRDAAIVLATTVAADLMAHGGR